jgi:hypothetical protein
MKLKDYIKLLQEIAKENPNALVITASDEEGNSYNPVMYKPSILYYSKNNSEVSDVKYEGYVEAVCIN